MNAFLDALLLVSFIVCGVYSLRMAIQMKSWRELKPNKFIYPHGCEPEDCAVIRHSKPRASILGHIKAKKPAGSAQSSGSQPWG